MGREERKNDQLLDFAWPSTVEAGVLPGPWRSRALGLLTA